MAFTLSDAQERRMLFLLRKISKYRPLIAEDPITLDLTLDPGENLGDLLDDAMSIHHTQRSKTSKILEGVQLFFEGSPKQTLDAAGVLANITELRAKWKIFDPDLPDPEPGRDYGQLLRPTNPTGPSPAPD